MKVESLVGAREIGVPGPGCAGRTAWRAFVAPELDGWRLVFGPFDLLVGDSSDGMTETVERVSDHCGRAQFFFLDDAGGSDVWIVAENGRVIRRCAAESDPEREGEPLPWETARPRRRRAPWAPGPPADTSRSTPARSARTPSCAATAGWP
ncbi:hypothetical protein [Streptomyces sp. NRRL B-3648]|uniref:hypothetical protein n=1 Tax=Streptomyces sp. NRRL B-3648 TaxID=1519493 RepID=UPI0006B06CA8|nr:hypothetical protein [Streptomyces sp. NRRL B-3648]